jgi:hypothetical protein
MLCTFNLPHKALDRISASWYNDCVMDNKGLMMDAQFDSKELAAAIRESTATLIKPRKVRKADRQVYGVKKTKTFLRGTDGDSNGYPKLNYFEKFSTHKSLGHF